MNEKQILLANLNKIHTTESGIDRIKKNLNLDADDVVAFCKNKIAATDCFVCKQGKNYYCLIDDIRFTIHANSYTIITAHKITTDEQVLKGVPGNL
jgi:hypothetical protein